MNRPVEPARAVPLPESDPDAVRIDGLALPAGDSDSGSDLAWFRPSDSGELTTTTTVPSPQATFRADVEMSSGGDLLAASEPDPFLESIARTEAAASPSFSAGTPAIVPGLDFSSPSVAIEPGAAGPGGPATGEGPVADPEPGRSALGMVLLSSYASAVTLALVWLLWQGDGRRGAAPPTIPSSSRIAIESGNGSAFVAALPAIPAVRLTTIGRPLRVGNLEVTPMAVWSGPVQLVSATSRRYRDGGDDALQLRLRLRNLSESEPFTPLEPGFVREPDQGAPESLIVAGDHPILPYRLATQSEWKIYEESFAPLEPGEERETVIVSESGARDKAAPSMTWRLRLRTAPHQTDIIGIGFDLGEIGDR